jgi:uncharacterized Fe-S cluster-containing radical SAM superfamily protein
MKTQKLRKARISGAEPTLCPGHLCNVLELVHKEVDEFDLFVIESNGIVIAMEDDFATRLAKYASRDPSDGTVGHVRLSIRGGLPKPYVEKTGCSPNSMELPFIAAQRLWDAGVSFHVAVVVDERFTSRQEKEIIYSKLNEINPLVRKQVEEETLDPYPHALVRLRAVGREDITGKEMSDKERYALSKRPPMD